MMDPMVCLQTKELSLGLRQVVIAPELPPTEHYPCSPVHSNPPSVVRSTLPSPARPPTEDSGFNSRQLSPTSPCQSITSMQDTESSPVFPSHCLIATGGTGFSFGAISCDGSLNQLSVPLPQQLLESSPDSPPIDITSFTLSDITTIDIVGECQLWAGTSNGTLHCFNLHSELRLTSHVYIDIHEKPILCICSRPLEYVFPSTAQPNVTLPSTSLTTEVLVGLPYGYIILLTGESDSKGHLKQSMDKLASRRIIRFTNSPVDCAVNSIVHAVSSTDRECYWCGCGGNIYVLRSSDWKKVKQLHARIDLSCGKEDKLEVSQLLTTEVGVWSYLSGFSSVCLWDKSNYSLKLHFNYCNTRRRSVHLQYETSCLHYSHPFLFIGTRQGDVIVFRITERVSEEQQRPSNTLQTVYNYTFISSTNIGTSPIISILSSTNSSGSSNVLLNALQTPDSSSINIQVLEGPGNETPGRSRIHMFELSLSPVNSLRSTPLSDITIVSSSSLRNTSLTPRKLSLVSSSLDYVPLKN